MYSPSASSAMGILLVYDVTDEASFDNVRNWMTQIEQHAAENVNRVLIGNKADLAADRRDVSSEEAAEYARGSGLDYFETSAPRMDSVEAPFLHLAKQFKNRYDEAVAEVENVVR